MISRESPNELDILKIDISQTDLSIESLESYNKIYNNIFKKPNATNKLVQTVLTPRQVAMFRACVSYRRSKKLHLVSKNTLSLLNNKINLKYFKF